MSTWVRGLQRGLQEARPDLDVTWFATDKPTTVSLAPRIGAGIDVARRLRTCVRERPPVLVHLCCGSDSSGWGLREAGVHAGIAQSAGSRVLLHLHASGFEDFWNRRTAERPLLRRLLRSVEGVAVLSAAQVDRFVERGVPPDRLFVLPNGVPVPPLAPPPPRTGKRPLHLLLVGTVEERKGIPDLLDAAQRVTAARGPVLRVDVVGPTAAAPGSMAEWKRRGSKIGVSFLGPCAPEEVAPLLAAADGLLLPSQAESQPFALLEAMAASRPVLATSIGEVAELLDGVGELVPPGDPRALEAVLLGWLDDDERRRSLAADAWHRVAERHSLASSVQATLSAWDALLASQA